MQWKSLYSRILSVSESVSVSVSVSVSKFDPDTDPDTDKILLYRDFHCIPSIPVTRDNEKLSQH
ncbi:MAG: hypothetical protein R6T92_07525, partial [Desulfosalsimonadaceae bacterium]